MSTFGIQELVKGFFPHKFNTQENQDYEGPMPPAEMYDPDGMSAKTKAEFERWYAQKVAANYHFVMRREMEAYCESDVKVLKAGCPKFRKEFQQHAEFDPIEKCVTIASACNRFWRKKLLTPNSIATEPMQGWQGAHSNQSVKAFKWLAWREHLLRRDSRFNDEPQKDRIWHANNGGKQRLLNFLVNGLDVQNHLVYEFHGCLWHGCPRCHPNHRDRHSKFHPDRTIQELYEVTQQKHRLLRQHGYNLQIMWECDWGREVKSNGDLKQFLASYETVEPLNPRDAFFGGRTNAVRLHYVADEDQGEQIKYVDVTSLYPWVNKTRQYPIGHPIIITNPENQDIQTYFGIAKVDVIPPHHRYHPVLPFRHGGKLTLPLCRTCMEEEMTKGLLEKSHHCSHSPEERLLRGTWCTPELVKAVEVGYHIVHIHEV